MCKLWIIRKIEILFLWNISELKSFVPHSIGNQTSLPKKKKSGFCEQISREFRSCVSQLLIA